MIHGKTSRCGSISIFHSEYYFKDSFFYDVKISEVQLSHNNKKNYIK